MWGRWSTSATTTRRRFQRFSGLRNWLPEAGPAWNFLGLCEYETKDYAKALEHLTTGQKLGDTDDPEISRVAKYHLALLLIYSGDFEAGTAELRPLVAEGQTGAKAKIALALAALRAPVLPEQVDPSQDALLQDVGSAATLAAQGQTAAATANFAALLEKYPATPYLHFAGGPRFSRPNTTSTRRPHFASETKLSPQSALPHVQLGRCELSLQRPQQALQAARTHGRLAPDSSAARELLGRSLEAANEGQKASQEFAAAKQLLPEKPVVEAAIRQRYLNPSGATTGNQPAVSAVDGSRDDWNVAMASYSSHHYTEAIAALKKWLERTPNSGTAWAVMGLSEFELKNYDNALIHLGRGQELGLGGNFESVQLAKYRLGILLNRNGQFEAAEEILNGVAGKGPLAAEVRFALGMSLVRLGILPGQVESAKERLVTAMGEIAELLKDSRYDEAFPKFETLLKQNPSAPFLHYVYGSALATLSRYDEAGEQLQKEILLTPARRIAVLQLASIALKQHRAEKRDGAARRGCEVGFSRSAEAHHLLGFEPTWRNGNEEASGGRIGKPPRKITPGSPQIHFNLAKGLREGESAP